MNLNPQEINKLKELGFKIVEACSTVRFRQTYRNHCLDFETCPHCNKCLFDIRENHNLLNLQSFRKLNPIIVLNPGISKPLTICIIFECSDCFERSWFHYSIAPIKKFLKCDNLS